MIEFDGETSGLKDDKTVDPDIALSYIGDRVQSILGHHQKHFEGGVSADNLGARFGGYGSFLPVYQRAPSIFSQSLSKKEPAQLHTHPHLAGEKDAFPDQRDRSLSSLSNHPSQALKVSLDSASNRKNSIRSPDEGATASLKEIEFSSRKPNNFSDFKNVRVRIKMGQNLVDKYNVEISKPSLTFSSSSGVHSHDETDGLSSESPQILGDSLTRIFQMMTASLVPGGLLLSPLSEDLQNFCRGVEYPAKDESGAAQKHFNLSVRPVKNYSLGQKNQSLPDHNCLKKSYNGDNPACTVQPFGDMKSKHLYDTPSGIAKVAEAKKVKVKLRHNAAEHHARIDSTDVQDFKFQNEQNHASFQAYSGDSETNRVKAEKHNSKLNASLDAKFIESGFGISPSVNGSALNCRKRVKASESSDELLPRADCLGIGRKSAKRHHDDPLGQKGMVNTRLDCMENPTRSSEEPLCKKPMNAGLRPVKLKSRSAGKLEQSNNVHIDRLSSGIRAMQPPVAGATFNGQSFSSLGETEIASEVIQEDWVACDTCEKWRLLPIGMKADQFPGKWACSMLDWLPGMNRCDISEEETTAAVRNLFQASVPVTLQGSVSESVDGVISASANQMSVVPTVSFNEIKKPKMEHPLHPRKKMHSLAMEDMCSKSVKLLPTGENMPNRASVHPSTELATFSTKMSARKHNDVIRDTDPRKKARKKPDCQLEAFGDDETREMKNGIDVACKFSNLDNQMKNLLPGKESLGAKGYKNEEVNAKKIKLKHSGDMQQSVSCQDSSRNLMDREIQIKKYNEDNGFATFRGILGDEADRRNHTESNARSNKNKAGLIYAGSKKEKMLSLPRARKQLTDKDIDKLKKDLGCEQMSTAANSSSSINPIESKGSPQESVSSFPTRMYYLKQALPMAMEAVDKVESKFDDHPNVGYVKKLSGQKESSKLKDSRRSSCPSIYNGLKILEERRDDGGRHCASKSDVIRNFPDGSILRSSQDGTSLGKRGSQKSNCDKKERDARRGEQDQSVGQSSDQMNLCRQKSNLEGDKEAASGICRHASESTESLKCCSTTSRLLDAAILGDTSKASIACLPDETNNFSSRHAVIPAALEPCLEYGNAGGVSVSTSLKKSEDVLREAEKLRNHAEFIQNSGFDSESNYEYFKAALKFLHGASLLEACCRDGGKHMVINLMQTYGAAAKLFKTCAYEYEKSHEMAAAALSFKCMEVAYLKVVYFKSTNTSKVWHELQSSLQMFPQGESPSSSASDVDNLNNLAIGEKACLSKAIASHTISARSQSNLGRLLDFTRDVNSGMEAAKKAREALAAAGRETKKNKEAMASVKRVIELSFQNVDELVTQVSLALNNVDNQPMN